MEYIKHFLKEPKQTAILGFIFSFLSIISCYKTFSILGIIDGLVFLISSSLIYIGLIIYFFIILLRFYKKQGNVNIANRVLIILLIIHTFYMTIRSIDNIIYTVIYIIFILYLFNILFRKMSFVNNKIFAVAMIVCAIYRFSNMIGYLNIFNIIFVLTDLAIIPYFYNYYDLLKGANSNGK